MNLMTVKKTVVEMEKGISIAQIYQALLKYKIKESGPMQQTGLSKTDGIAIGTTFRANNINQTVLSSIPPSGLYAKIELNQFCSVHSL